MPDTQHVLIVEDEPLILFAMSDHLEDEGFRVSTAKNADDAIRLLEAHPDIKMLFTDIDMPGSMDGLVLSAAVRDRWPPIKIIVTSGHREVEITDIPDGAVFFSKPYDQEEVVTSIRDMLHAA